MPTSGKKNTTKASHKNNSSANKSRVSTHPSWMDMIKECIIAHPDESRSGVSRPTIKKFVESTYHVAVDHAAASQLNRAITSGSEKGTFVLPKGPSGKVKLAPQARTDAAKEVCHNLVVVGDFLMDCFLLYSRMLNPSQRSLHPLKA
ncbi:hypothetical protein C0993_006133 [Termitomyces sp. T159_Od127]|nr:hypothetical protein C0993_006133 [Termitomyces sp. T159_Od127]